MSGTFQQSPYLRVQRNFPSDNLQALGVEIDKAYIDTAQRVNSRTIGLFALGNQIVNGEAWYLSGQPNKQQALRQIYLFNDSTLTITHGINFASLTNFVRIWGTFFDGTYWQTLPYVDVTAANNQINVKVSSTQIIITKGAGAPPSISNGIVVLEWLSNP